MELERASEYRCPVKEPVQTTALAMIIELLSIAFNNVPIVGVPLMVTVPAWKIILPRVLAESPLVEFPDIVKLAVNMICPPHDARAWEKEVPEEVRITSVPTTIWPLPSAQRSFWEQALEIVRA